MRFGYIFGVVLSLLALPRVEAINYLIPANAEEILYALGPDGNGLRIIDDELPDLFGLTASRLEEDPKLFTVAQPYASGRWSGGRAVIEYARDLSYTQVSIFDKNGKRQRIYSVRSRLGQPKDDRPTEVAKTTPESASSPNDKPRRRRAEPAAETPAAESEQNVEPQYEWDEVRGEYVPLKAVPAAVVVASVPKPIPPAPPTPPVKVSPPPAQPIPPAKVSPPPVTETIVPPPPVVAEKKALPVPKSAKAEKAAPVVVPIPAVSAQSGASEFVWDDEQGTYVAKGSVAPKASAPASAKGKVAPVQPVVQTEPVDLHPAPLVTERWGALTESERLAEKKSASSRSRASKTEPVVVAAIPKSAPVPASVPVAVPVPIPVPVPVSVPASHVDTHVPSTEELLSMDAPPEKPSAAVKPSGVTNVRLPRNRKAEAAQGVDGAAVLVESTDAYDLPVDESGKPVQRRSEKYPVPPELVAAQKVLAAEEAAKAAAPALPASLASDSWVPKKNVPAPAPEPDIPEPKVVALLPKTPAPGNSVDDLLKMAGNSPGQMPNESDKWVPRAAKVQTPDVDIKDEIKRAQNMKVAKPNYVPPPVRKDINNPEEGVLPVSSFEKFSGGRYGRHREYERRFFPGKKSKGLLDPKEYDFYVDEVDRKKEFHNVYYYRTAGKGQPPKLVAVQKHEDVTFMSNYDVDKEDKGKLKRY